MQSMIRLTGGLMRAGLAALLFTGLLATAVAHPGHGDPISREQAVQRGSEEIGRLVSAGKLEKSWKIAAMLKTADVHGASDSREWALTFSNPQAKPEQQTLYVFLSETGEYLAANFTGK